MRVSIGPYPEGEEEREVSVEIDDYDTWSLDHTLACIILPLLKQYKATMHGAGYVDDEDVPDELKSINSVRDPDDQLDVNYFKRWDWIVDRMIYAFDHIVDTSWEDNLTGLPESNDHLVRVVEADIKDGTRLFGKYFQALWD